jgi:hypothetical protein
MNLSVLDRVILLTVLPREGDFSTLRILQDLKMALSFTEVEVKKFNIAVNPEVGNTTWENDEDIEVPMGEKATDIVVEALKELNRKKKLTLDMMETYEKFIAPD